MNCLFTTWMKAKIIFDTKGSLVSFTLLISWIVSHIASVNKKDKFLFITFFFFFNFLWQPVFYVQTPIIHCYQKGIFHHSFLTIDLLKYSQFVAKKMWKRRGGKSKRWEHWDIFYRGRVPKTCQYWVKWFLKEHSHFHVFAFHEIFLHFLYIVKSWARSL